MSTIESCPFNNVANFTSRSLMFDRSCRISVLTVEAEPKLTGKPVGQLSGLGLQRNRESHHINIGINSASPSKNFRSSRFYFLSLIQAGFSLTLNFLKTIETCRGPPPVVATRAYSCPETLIAAVLGMIINICMKLKFGMLTFHR